MFGLFKKKNSKSEVEAPKVVPLKPIDYPSLVILAWAKAVEGNPDLQKWLLDEGYNELYLSVYAIYLKDEARDWLVENGYAHIMAMIHAAEGNKKARKWLIDNRFETLYHIALAVDHEADSWDWLTKNASRDLLILAQSIQRVKDQIEENHNDPHSFKRDF